MGYDNIEQEVKREIREEELLEKIECLKEYIDQLEHEKQLLYGRLNMIRDLTEKEIK